MAQQQQQQNVTINVQSSGDPALENRILNELYSAGKQLSSLAAMVELLLATRTADFFLTPEQLKAQGEFEEMQRAIDAERLRRKPGRIVEQLEQLPPGSAEAKELLVELRAWLATYEQNG